MSPLTQATLVHIPLIPFAGIDINIPFQGMNGALSADLARVLNLQGQPASPTHMQVLYLSEEETKASSLYQQLD